MVMATVKKGKPDLRKKGTFVCDFSSRDWSMEGLG